METIKNKLQLNATTLKILALVLMVCDHIHQMWAHAGAPMWLTCLGRPVFPMFLFAMSESFYYTSNRKKFLKRLLMAAWLMLAGTALLQFILPNRDIMLMNNAFMTFFIAGLYMLFYDRLVDGIKTKKAGKIVGAVLLCLVPVVTAAPLFAIGTLSANEAISPETIRALAGAALFIPNVFVVEGGFIMVITGVLFYALRKWRWAQMAVLAALSILIVVKNPSDFQWFMIVAAIPILLYNGEKGRGMKNFFYIFYPAHIYILYIIATLWK